MPTSLLRSLTITLSPRKQNKLLIYTSNLRLRRLFVYSENSDVKNNRKDLIMNLPRLDRRLECAAELVRHGASVVDVGTDHAYVPIYLVATGKCPSALATDVNQGPIDRAKINIVSYGLSDKISTLKTDGLKGVEGFDPECVMILGMGGELIARIISEAEWLRRTDKKIRLVLQPMTHPEYVRKYLFDNGFDIVDEKICKSGKYYDIMAAEYDGIHRKYTELDALIGKINRVRRDDITLEYFSHLADIYRRRVDGLLKGGFDASFEEAMLRELKALIK